MAKKNVLFVGMLALALVFGMALAGCSNGDDGGGDPTVKAPAVGDLPDKSGGTWVSNETAAKTLYEAILGSLNIRFLETVRSAADKDEGAEKTATSLDFVGDTAITEGLTGTVTASVHDSWSTTHRTMNLDIAAKTPIVGTSGTAAAGSVWRQSRSTTGVSGGAFTQKDAYAYGITVVKDSGAAKIIYTSNTTETGDNSSWVRTGSETITVYGANDAVVWKETYPIEKSGPED
ncbi:MAG: hypothetical protein LBS64_05230 [Spirochaetaceae bacterium]|jgi:hypothetical protein|nr:hypothetical protein [Spirochaetaceae bacterium]